MHMGAGHSVGDIQLALCNINNEKSLNDMSYAKPTSQKHGETDSNKDLKCEVEANSSSLGKISDSNMSFKSLRTNNSTCNEPKKSFSYTAITSSMSNELLPLMSIPDVALEKILSFLSYDQVAQMRIICKR